MRIHGDKKIQRRPEVDGLKHYRDAKDMLHEDFYRMCGYCGKSSRIMRQRFHIDHFVPKSLDKDRENDYYNLVLSCAKCNLSKSNKWPTKDKNKAYANEKGFVDPATDEFDNHIRRNSEGYVYGITHLGEYMCKQLNFDIRRSDLYWKISCLREQQIKMEQLFKEKRLSEKEKDFYIESNMLLNDYIEEAFRKGE